MTIQNSNRKSRNAAASSGASSAASSVLPSASTSVSPCQARDTFWIAQLETRLGPMLSGIHNSQLCLLEFADQPTLQTGIAALERCFGIKAIPERAALHDSVQNQLDEYFAGTRLGFDLPLELPGSDFQRLVWAALLAIPYGQTRSYASQAAAISRPQAVRAAAAANGRNRVAIVVPCHRVIGADGRLTGYAGGLERKRWLLQHEAAGLLQHEAARLP